MHPFLQQLLQGQAVEWRALGEVAEITRGVTYNKSLEVEKNGYRILRANNITVEFSKLNFDDVKQISKEAKVKDTQKLYENDILISIASGSREHVGKVAFIHEDIDFYFGGFMAVIRTKKLVNPRYMFHILKSHYFSQFLEKTFASATINNLSNSVLKEFQIPIPPLSVQSQIVQILDTFTELTAELTAELSMRQKQYQYYRDFLLSEHELAKVGFEWKTLGEVVLPTNNIRWHESDLSYRYIDLSSVDKDNNNIGETLEITSKNAPSRAQKIVRKDDVIFATTRPTQMRSALIPPNLDGQIASTGYCILRANQNEVLPKWIYYNLQIDEFKIYLQDKQSGTAYPAISDGLIKQFQIPIPPLSVQSQIVAILDTFDTLTQSISEGLPKEIQLRQKQYEYYRELLLGFDN
ncbi:Type I restriction-modification system, specificity subunit S [Moraxella catarrhalis]|uniref:restriction endonuclease subunit S n=1 Tax=Moraxella catarrhalis TaxID=480 RepID=UPI0007E46F6C|nr:restriction endonuclease subunit S [Moraxella catarrhalis]OAV27786.1 Type I restriction-modification system, specificity subunit S [Moraxella catarrhalis]